MIAKAWRILMVVLLILASIGLPFETLYAQGKPSSKKGAGKKKGGTTLKKGETTPASVTTPAEELWKHTGGNLLSTSFSPDGKNAVSINSEGVILFWDVESGRMIRSIHYGIKDTAATFFGNKKVALAGGLDKDNAIFILDLNNGKEVSTLAGHKGGGKSLAFSSDGEAILSGGWNNQVVLWGAARGDILRVFKGHDGVVNTLAVSPDQVLAASGSADGKIKIWNMSTGELVRTIKAHKQGVLSVAFSPDGKRILSGGVEKGKGKDKKKDTYPIRLWDVATGKPIVKKNIGEQTGELSTALFSRDGKYALSAGHDGALKLWDIAAASVVTKQKNAPPPEAVRTFEGHGGRVLTATFSPDGTRVLAGGDGTLTIWETETGKLLGGGSSNPGKISQPDGSGPPPVDIAPPEPVASPPKG